jgi:hypothetical protein
VIPGTLGSFRVVENMLLTIATEDWSRVRSPARARRRMKRGFKQNVVHGRKPDPTVYRMGDTLIMHPETARAMERELKRQRDVAEAMAMYGADVNGMIVREPYAGILGFGAGKV